MTHWKREIAVVGGGLAGTATAIGFAAEGFDTVLLAPPPPREDRRSTALIGPSVAFLSQIGVLASLAGKTQALAVMRLIDDTRRLLRAPAVTFRASEIGLDAFGYNVLNADLSAAMMARAEMLADRLTIVEETVTGLAADDECVTLSLGDGSTVAASLAVGADGRGSAVRTASGLSLRDWAYPQTAIVLNFTHERDHGATSTEFHTRSGPFTQVPLPGRASSLVWVETPGTAELIVDLKPERLAQMIEERMHSILGAVRVDGPVQSFALKGATVSRMIASRVALVGEAAHVFPPIGAQGLNLGLRDAAAIVEVATGSRDDPGRASTLARYEAARRGDVLSRTVGVDLLNRSLLAGFLPAQAARAVGLSALAAFAPLRRFAMREGVSPGSGLVGLPSSVREGIGGN